MLTRVRYVFLFMMVGGCVEPFEFVVRDKAPSLVVEASISDRSFIETLSYPSDGRWFTVKLTETGDVTNARPLPVAGAVVELLVSDGSVYRYTEGRNGEYMLYEPGFAARPGIGYKLRITTPDEHVHESSWEQLPEGNVPAMGNIGFSEIEKKVYVMESESWVIRSKQFVRTHIDVPENTSGASHYYRWTFHPTWIYVAPLIRRTEPNAVCWATDPSYLGSFALQADRSGGYEKGLFDFLTIRNERIFEKLSVLVIQHAMTDDYYTFWKEMQDRNEGSAIVDTPPFNLATNFTSPTGGKTASGYFGVTSEQATRWYFDASDLSYPVSNTLLGDCMVFYGPGGPAPECLDCREYSFGTATTVMPQWWQR